MKSGLNWVTTTVVNTLENKNGFAETIKGAAVPGATFPQSLQGSGKKSLIRVMSENVRGSQNPLLSLQVAHVNNFYQDWDNRYGKVTRIVKNPSIAGKLAEIEIDFSAFITAITSPAKMYKLFVYISVDGANPFYYSNDFNVKGLPFACEFTQIQGETAADVADKVYKLITKNHIFQIDSDQIDVELNGTVLTLKAKETFQRFALVKVAEFGPWDDYSIPVSFIEADKYVVINGVPSVPTAKLNPSAIVCKEVGKTEFGTAAQIQQDLRLPTIENLKWGSSTNWQQPIAGKTYTQYIITVQSPANNGGVMAVGERMLTESTHIFWIVEGGNEITDFDAALTAIGFSSNPTTKGDGSAFETGVATNSTIVEQ